MTDLIEKVRLFFRKVFKSNKIRMQEILKHIDRHDDLVYRRIEEIIERSIKDKTGHDVDVKKYVNAVDKNLTNQAQNFIEKKV